MMLQPLQRQEWHRSTSSNEYKGKGGGRWGGIVSQVRQDRRAICMSGAFISWKLCAF